MTPANDRLFEQQTSLRRHRHLAQIALGCLFAAVVLIVVVTLISQAG